MAEVMIDASFHFLLDCPHTSAPFIAADDYLARTTVLPGLLLTLACFRKLAGRGPQIVYQRDRQSSLRVSTVRNETQPSIKRPSLDTRGTKTHSSHVPLRTPFFASRASSICRLPLPTIPS